jgi:putative SOS response-associated peptidase YedK
MCGRYTLAAPNPAQVRARFPIGEEVEVRPRYNVAPGDDVLAVTADREGAPRGELLRWGLVPSWADSPATGLKMINARIETVAERPAYRRAFERFRCLIVADGFYEWQRSTGGGPKQPFHITRADGMPFAFAGLWSVWRPSPAGEGPPEGLRTCTIVTRPANTAVVELHDRMPVILAPEGEAEWLDAGTPPARLFELASGLEARATSIRAVGTAVNDARYDGPECLAPAPEPAQSALF